MLRGATWEVERSAIDEPKKLAAIACYGSQTRAFGGLVGIWMDRYGGESTAQSTLNMFWTARVVGGEPRAADDVAELAWFAPGELPPAEELAFECVGLALAAWRDQRP